MKYLGVTLITLIHLTTGFIIKSWITFPSLPKCDKEKVPVPELYIEKVRGYSILKRCHTGSRFSRSACGCVMPIPITPNLYNVISPARTNVLLSRNNKDRLGIPVNVSLSIDRTRTVSPLFVIKGIDNVIPSSFDLSKVGNSIELPRMSDSIFRRNGNEDSIFSRISTTLPENLDSKIQSQNLVSSTFPHFVTPTTPETIPSRRTTDNVVTQTYSENTISILNTEQTNLQNIPETIISHFTTTVNSFDVDIGNNDSYEFCPPDFRFIYDRTTISENRSVPSLKTDTIGFIRVPGSSGETSAHFGGNGMITVWTMSYITFASKFKFVIRFGLLKNYKYEDKLYNLFGDGPCKNYTPRYSFLVNPVKNEIHAHLKLRNKSNVSLTLQNVNLDGWVRLEVKAKHGDITLSTDDREVTGTIGASTIKSSPCPMVVGKDSKYAAGFVGYIDMIEFRNCFGR